MKEAEASRAEYKVLGQCLQPPSQLAELAAPQRHSSDPLYQVRGPLRIARGERVAHRFGRRPLALEPLARPAVQLGNKLGSRLMQVLVKELGEEVMIPKPTPLVVQRDEEQVCPFQLLQHRLAITPAGNGVAQWSTQAIQHGGL